MPTTSVSAMPRSPRYSCTQCSSAAFWKSAQLHADCLERLQVLVRHGADGRQVVLAREIHVGGALEVLRHFARRALDHFLVPFAREAPARAEVEELERMTAHEPLFSNCRSVSIFAGEAAAALGEQRPA